MLFMIGAKAAIEGAWSVWVWGMSGRSPGFSQSLCDFQ